MNDDTSHPGLVVLLTTSSSGQGEGEVIPGTTAEVPKSLYESSSEGSLTEATRMVQAKEKMTNKLQGSQIVAQDITVLCIPAKTVLL